MIANEAMAQEVLDWFGSKGILPETVATFGIRVAGDGAIVFPYGEGLEKRRYGVPTGERSFRWQTGTTPILYNQGDIARYENIIVCEGETDTLRLWQELELLDRRSGSGEATRNVGVVGLPGIETWNSDMAASLFPSKSVYVILDNDGDYRVAGRVDAAFRAIRHDLGRRARRVVLPRGVNDVCEFFEDYDIDALRLLISRQPNVGDSRFKTLDLTTEPAPPKWLVTDMICQGDIHLLIGEPGIGKSWLTMGLAVAVAEGRREFIGFPLATNGRVLYFDEENPEDLIYKRLSQLGLTEVGIENLRVVNNFGIRLDLDPTAVIDEALDFDPVLIVLDSLTRFHGQDENSAGAMADLFNSAIKPLARSTGAAVVLIHHANKTDSTSSYKRSRGSGDITASVDSGFDVHKLEDETLKIHNFKSRRSTQVDSRYVSIMDKADGSVELLGMSGISKVF